MEPLLLPWIARGIKEDSGEYLVSLDEELKNSDTNNTVSSDRTDLPVYPDMPFTDALPILIRIRGSHTPGVIEYGCFNLDGTLIDDIRLRMGRQRRNILYYMIGRMFNISRGESQFDPGAPFGADPVSDSPEGN